jgi:hypothetical protein
VLSLSSSAATQANLTLVGPLFAATNANITSTDFMFGVFDSSRLTSATSSPLISFTGGSAFAGFGAAPGLSGALIGLASGLGLSPTVTLAGPLLSGVNTSFRNGDPMLNALSLVFIGDSAKLTDTSTSALFSLSGTSVDTAGSFLSLRRSLTVNDPTRVMLAGPLLSATNGTTINTTSLGFGSACCSGFGVRQGAELTSTTTAGLIQLTDSTFNAGPDIQSGGGFFDVTDAGSDGPVTAPARVTLAGPLLVANNSTISALFDALVVARSSFTTSSADPVIHLSNSNLTLGGTNAFGNVPTFARVVGLVSSATAGTPGSATSMSLTGAGPLLVATNSSIRTALDTIGVFNGATFSSAATVPLVQIVGGSLETGTYDIFSGYVLVASAIGGPTGSGFALASLAGPLLSSTGTLNLAGGLVGVFSGGQVTSTGSVNPFVFVDGGTHAISGGPSAGIAMFGLSGRPTATALDAQSGLLLGTDRPLQGPLQLDGTRPMLTPLLETSGATVTGGKVLRIDNALLEATAPLLNLTAKGVTQSMLTATGTNAMDLTFAARVSTLGGSVIRLDNSVLNVANGSLVNVNASKLTVGGDLVNLVNGATLTLFNGPLITVAGNGFANITGGLINFGGTGGNTVNVTNSLCPCTLFGGIPVALQNGALAQNVQISSPIKNPTLGTLNLSPNAALAVVNGAGSKLTVGAQ